MLRSGFLVGLALVLPGSAPEAQEAMIALGSSVRIESTFERKLHGILLARDADSITVGKSSGVPTTVPVTSVVRIQVRNGRSRMTGLALGAKRGAIVGVSLVGALCLVSLAEVNQDDLEFLPMFVLVGAGYGAVMGGLIGGVVGAKRWTTVFGRTVRASYRPHPNGRVSIGLEIK